MTSDYDEDELLTEYIWFNYAYLMTEAEQFGHKAAVHNDPELASTYRQHFGAETWSQMVRNYSDGPSAFRRRVRDRLLREHGRELVVQRCPQCQRIVKTPKAKQCRWCGHNWRSDAN